MTKQIVYLIDGRSGSGKTEYARELAELIPGAQVIHMDHVYPGWDGLQGGADYVPTLIQTLRWREWSYETSSYGEWQQLDPELPLIIEGVGSLSAASRPLAAKRVWMETDDATRKRRALRREPHFAEHWDMWAAQEELYIAKENPRELADVIIDTSHVER